MQWCLRSLLVSVRLGFFVMFGKGEPEGESPLFIAGCAGIPRRFTGISAGIQR